MRRIFRENGLSIVLFTLFLVFLTGQSLTGQRQYNEEQLEHGQPTLGYVEYLASSHFVEATFENWESEFLQMAMYVVLTIFLFQKGSSESKRVDAVEPVDLDPATPPREDAPWPVKRGGWILKLYQNSLSLAFVVLFFLSFALHAAGGAREYNEEQKAHGSQEQLTTIQYVATSRFWFESFQNWQSEFLAMGLMVYLSIYLRQKGSPESKPVDAPHDDTGSD